MTKEKNISSEQKLLIWRDLMQSKFSPVKLLPDLIKYPVITEKSYVSLFKKHFLTILKHISHISKKNCIVAENEVHKRDA